MHLGACFAGPCVAELRHFTRLRIPESNGPGSPAPTPTAVPRRRCGLERCRKSLAGTDMWHTGGGQLQG